MKPINKILLNSLICCTLTLVNFTYLSSQTIPSGANISMGGGSTISDSSIDWHVYQTIAKYVIGASLFISLIIVIYHVSINSPKSKTAMVSCLWL